MTTLKTAVYLIHQLGSAHEWSGVWTGPKEINNPLLGSKPCWIMGAFHYAIISENVGGRNMSIWRFVQEEICSNIGQPPISVPLALVGWSFWLKLWYRCIFRFTIPRFTIQLVNGKASVRTAKILSEFEQELLSFKVVSSNGFLNILTSKGTYKRRRIRVIYYSKTSIRRPSVGEPASAHLMEIGR